MKDNDLLNQQFDKGIKRTWWKSHLDHDPIEDAKVNQLRKLLELEPLPRALPEGTYDAESVSELRKIDFSSLDVDGWSWLLGAHNIRKRVALKLKGLNLKPFQDYDVNITGADAAKNLAPSFEGDSRVSVEDYNVNAAGDVAIVIND